MQAGLIALTVAVAGGVLLGTAGTSPAPQPQPVATHATAAHWGYEGADGPLAWAALSPAWRECRAGRLQSPVNLPAAVAVDAPAAAPAHLRVFHHEHAIDVVNNGHTVEVDYDDGDELELDGKLFRLVQYHFHTPSEHTVAGEHFPMEMHLVHRAADGELAVIGIFLERGAHNPAYDPVWEHMPHYQDGRQHLEHVSIDIDELLPVARRGFRYTGSLTTPPCTEGVRWLVLRTPVGLGADQIAAFETLVHANSRPVQPLNARPLAATALEAEDAAP